MAITEIAPGRPEPSARPAAPGCLDEMEAARPRRPRRSGRVANARYVSGVPRLWNAGHPTVRPGLRGRPGDRGDPPPQHLGRGRPRGDPPRPPVRDLVEPDELRRGARRASTGRRRPARVGTDAHVTAVRASCCRWPSPTAEIVDGGAAAATRPGASRPPTRSTPSGPPSRVAERALAAAVAALRPGVTERQLTGVFMEAMASHGVTTPATQDVAWITSPERPWHRPGRDVPVAGRRPRGLRRRRRRRRLRRRGGPHLVGRRRPDAGGRRPVPPLGRAVGPTARRLPARCPGDRPARRLRAPPASRCPPCRWPAAWASASTIP